ncbi:ATP-binding protein, partial [Rhizobiaceae sp. 2RAB30]
AVLLGDRLEAGALPDGVDDHAAATPSAAALAARRTYEEARKVMIEDGEPAAIDRVSALFQLSPFEEDVLLLALARQLRASFASLYVKFHGRATLDHATPHLATVLFAGAGPEAEAEAWDRLSPDAPLRRFLLVEGLERTLTPLSAITLDERMGRLLVGEQTDEPRTQPMLFEAEPAVFPERHRAGVERLAARLRTARRPLAVIIGHKRSGRAAAAAALAAQFGLGLALFRQRPFEPVQDLLALVGREATLGGFALLVDAAQPDVVGLLHHRIDALVIAIAETRPDLPFDVPHLRLEALDQTDHAALWRDTLGLRIAGTDERVEAIADQFRFSPGEIAAIVSDGGDLWQSCRDRAGRALEELAERIVPRYRWEDMVMPAEILHDLRAVTAQVRHRSLVYVRHGFARKLVRGRGVSVLLSGPSGTGKTMAAEVIAGDLKLDLYRIDLSGVISKYIGETEKNLKAVFDAAEASGAVLFFDEADALFGKRSEVKDSHDRYANIEVSYLLQRMESYGGLAILATNMKGHLDSAFLRRLRFAIDIPFPDASLRRAIWTKAFPEETPKASLDFDALARLDIAGGNITVIAVNAAFLAAAEGVPLAMRHVARAARSEFRKLDKEFRMPWPEAS